MPQQQPVLIARPWLEEKAVVEYDHSSDMHLQGSDFPSKVHEALQVQCTDCNRPVPSHFEECLVGGMETSVKSYSF